MAAKGLNINVCSLLKLRSGLTGKYHAICHDPYNLPLGIIAERPQNIITLGNILKIYIVDKQTLYLHLYKRYLETAWMYLYHNKIKQRIKNNELINYEYVNKYKNISPCLLLYFSTEPKIKPIREHRFEEYERIFKELLKHKI